MAAFLGLSDYWWDWGNLLFRFLHVIAAIAWIGSSFYFIALDLHLLPPAEKRDADRGVGGEVWEIHGGGFYRVEKFRVAPATLPEPLHWFKWEAYTTWLSGFALLVAVYYAHASAYLIDPSVAHLSTWSAIGISVGGLALAWVVYDVACRLLGRDEWALAIVVLAFVVLSAWGAGQLFSARGAYIEVGAMLGTIMAANVFFVIIPAHWELVRAKQAGREPDPVWNVRGKQRSVHNNYFTLPVLFAMLSNHFSFVYGHKHAWLLLVAFLVLGAVIRLFFNLHHAGRDVWWIAVGVLAAIVVLMVLLRPSSSRPAAGGPVPTLAQVQSVLAVRCAPCHSLNPTEPGISSPPAGVVLVTPEQIQVLAGAIKTEAVDNKLMPPGNVTGMTQAERDLLARWLASR